ncbi:proteasome subunit alpha type-4-like [Drosophila pseudoobscura]|uniref:Proteasome subunit alpha type n=1 Tax=Drosophila pseudoobscura pseudoobscura TaxID=46245 RepID=A0A6I8UYN2_DROPS|nr:proteasome subunit alpha type-4 [Drosophila pseudoobscura]
MARLYDPRAVQFSPEGRLYQVEYAMEAVCASNLCLGLVAADGVLLAAERCNSRLVGGPSGKMFRLASNVACTWAGVSADATKLIDEMRISAQRFRFNYGETIPCEGLVADICDVKQSYTQWGGRRPFGVSILYMGWDEVYGYQLYNSDPSGNYSGWKATAAGHDFDVASSLLEQEIDPEVSISLEEAKDLAMKVLDCTLGTANLIPNKLEMSTLHRASDGCCIYTLLEMSDVEKLTEKYTKGGDAN